MAWEGGSAPAAAPSWRAIGEAVRAAGVPCAPLPSPGPPEALPVELGGWFLEPANDPRIGQM